jgi:N-acetylglucosamine kinase-like BadF-type ATPase
VGALGLREGVVVAAGTGVVTLATDGATRHARVDGWGYLVGDLGSGYWIGRSGLEAALRAADGRGGSSELLRRARELDGDVETLPVRLAADPDRVPRIALFAEQVADAAQAGDATARQIWADAAEHLADSVAAACERVALAGSIAVSWTGRLFDARALLLEPFGEAVRRRLPCAVLTPAEGDALDGAHRLAGLVSLPALQPLLSSAVRDTITVMERS